MARNEAHVDAPPDRVWAVLADPRSYGEWVVGSRKIRGWDDDWPAPGSRFYHEVGVPPVITRDHTEVLERDEPRRLKLRARARPLGTAIVTVEIRPDGAGSHVVLLEDPGDPLTRVVTLPWWWLAVRLRNTGSIQRLKEIAEGRRAPDPTP
jgi:uncharacterized protein YndB with AHSA1/START domain